MNRSRSRSAPRACVAPLAVIRTLPLDTHRLPLPSRTYSASENSPAAHLSTISSFGRASLAFCFCVSCLLTFRTSLTLRRLQARGVVDAVCALHDANRGEAITKEACLLLCRGGGRAVFGVLLFCAICRVGCHQRGKPHECWLPLPHNAGHGARLSVCATHAKNSRSSPLYPEIPSRK